jgi:hypothetical protein
MECRRCGTQFGDVSSEELATRRCRLCGYVTVNGRAARVEIPLEHFPEYAPSTQVLLADEKEHEAACTTIARIRHEVLAPVQQRVDESRAAALQWLLSLLSSAGGLSEKAMAGLTRDGSRPFRIAQIMYALLLRRGALDFGVDPPGSTPEFFRQDAYTVLGDVSALSSALTLGRQGLYRVRIEDRRLVGERTETDLALFELVHNIDSGVERPGLEAPREIFDERLVESQKLAFGHAVQDLFALVDPMGADTGLAGRQEGDLVFVDLAKSTPEARSLIEQFVLTLARWRNSDAPYFFDLGPRAAAPRVEDRLIDEAADAMWLAYYPFLDARTARRPPEPMAVTTVALLIATLATADISQAHMLHRAQQEANRRDPATRDRVAWLARSVHASFEADVAKRLVTNGMTAFSGITEIAGKSLECGEIDVLAGGPAQGGGSVALVCEAKNVDLAVQKDGGYVHLQATLARARDQVRRKTAWAARHGREVAELLGLDRSPVSTVGLIVTRRPVPLPLLGGWPGAVPSELDDIVRLLMRVPVGDWRADIAQGMFAPREERA